MHFRTEQSAETTKESNEHSVRSVTRSEDDGEPTGLLCKKGMLHEYASRRQ